MTPISVLLNRLKVSLGPTRSFSVIPTNLTVLPQESVSEKRVCMLSPTAAAHVVSKLCISYVDTAICKLAQTSEVPAAEGRWVPSWIVPMGSHTALSKL